MFKLKTESQIREFLIDSNIFNFKINSDLSVDIHESVSISYLDLTELPFQFGTILGFFDCSYNELTNLKGSPHTIQGYFDCSNNYLTSLEFGPKKVDSYYNCYNNELTNLDYIARYIGKDVDFRFNKIENNVFLSNIKGNIFTSVNDKSVQLSDFGEILNKSTFSELNKRKSIIKEIIKNGKA